jgi:exopolyphosphatase/guanosine-5'-triphosphate,3'-diphosphate pyrophosphatase
MRCACIDIGSNTTRLLVAEPDDTGLREVVATRVFTRIGAPALDSGSIPAEKIDEVSRVVADQVLLARESGAGHIRIVATAAIRDAANREPFAAAVEAASGLPVAILSSDDEARLAFLGATRTLPEPPVGEVGVVDIGGGSSEVVCGTVEGGVSWVASLPVGSGRLADRYLRSDPPEPAELAALREHVDGVFAGLDAPQPSCAYAVGGSATSLRRLLGPELTRTALEDGLRALIDGPCAQVAARLDLHPERVRILPAGMLLLAAAAKALGVVLQVARGGLREGVILEDCMESR